MTKPIIGITPLLDPESGFYHIRENYTQAVEKAGGVPFILPLTKDKQVLEPFLNLIDGLIFSGGHDIDPIHYSDLDYGTSGIHCPIRDEMEIYLYKQAILKDIPILGICRGMQLINIAGGGSLFQDIQSETSSTITHYVLPKNGQGLPSDGENEHFVRLAASSFLNEELGTELLHVNSFHHQAVNKLGDSFEVLATSEDGIIEAIYHTSACWVVGVQWHPEILFEKEKEHFYFFKKLVSKAQEYQTLKYNI